MRNIYLKLQYDGTNYCGWQFQKNGQSIQNALEDSLKKLLNQNIRIIGSGRTDAGVHALGQVAVFKTGNTLKCENILAGLNSILPDDIRVIEVRDVNNDFHPRYSAKWRFYRYLIYNGSVMNPVFRNYVYYYPYKINIKFLKKTARYVMGIHDFKSFAGSGDTCKSKIRNIKKIRINKYNNIICIDIIANAFLMHMVRIVIGTLLDLYMKNESPSKIKEILASRDRRQAGRTISSKGLYLVNVSY